MVDSGTLKLLEIVNRLNAGADSFSLKETSLKKKYNDSVNAAKETSKIQKGSALFEKEQKLQTLNDKYDVFYQDRKGLLKSLDDVIVGLKRVGYDKYIDYTADIPIAEPSVIQGLNAKIAAINEEGIIAFFSRLLFKSRREQVMELYADVEGCRKYINNEITVAKKELSAAVSDVENTYRSKMKRIQSSEDWAIESEKTSYQNNYSSLVQQSNTSIHNAAYSEYQRIVKDYYAENGINKNFWTSYVRPNNYKNRVLLGMGMIKANSAGNNMSIYSSSLPSTCFSNGTFMLPVVIDFKKGFNVYIGYNESERSRVINGINSFLLKTISVTTLKSVSWSVFDPKFNGGSIGNLERFTKVSSGILGGMVYCRKNEVDSRFSYLEDLIRTRNAWLASGPNGGYKDFHEFNRKNGSKKITMHIATLYDAQYDVYRQHINTIEKILQDGERLGISLIILRQKEKVQQYGNQRDIYKENFLKLLPIRFENDDFYIRIGKKGVLFRFNAPPQKIDSYLEQLNKAFETKPPVKNEFPHFYSESTKLYTMDSTKGLNIPFAITQKGNLSYLRIDHNNCAHVMIGGVPGSGKSVALLSILNGIVINYDPDDVEVWAIDYGNTTFGKFKTQQLPHIRRIITDKSPEFATALVDDLNNMVKERNLLWEKYNAPGRTLIDDIEKFRAALVASHGTYKKEHLARRIVILMDEFQFFTKALSDKDNKNPLASYRKDLERLLKVLRKCGIHFVFSSQDIPQGSEGFTQTSENWIPVRLCLRTDGNATLENQILRLDSTVANEVREKMLKDMASTAGSVVYKRPLMSKEKPGDDCIMEGTNNIIRKNIVIRMATDKDWAVADKLYDRIRAQSKSTETTEMFVSTDRKSIDKIPDHPLNSTMKVSENMNLFIGEAIGFSSELSITLTRRTEQNILLVGGKDSEEQSKRESTLVFMLLSAMARKDVEINVLRFDDLNIVHSKILEQMLITFNSCANFNYYIGSDQISNYFNNFDRSPQSVGVEKRLYVWLDIENIQLIESIQDNEYDYDVNDLDIEPDFESNEEDTDESNAILMHVSKSKEARSNPVKKRPVSLDKLKNDIKFLAVDGNRHGNWNIVMTDSYSILHDSKYFEIKQFGYRIGFKMSPDYLAKIFSITTKINEIITDTTSAYQDVSEAAPIAYRPFLLPGRQWTTDYLKKCSKWK